MLCSTPNQQKNYKTATLFNILVQIIPLKLSKNACDIETVQQNFIYNHQINFFCEQTENDNHL